MKIAYSLILLISMISCSLDKGRNSLNEGELETQDTVFFANGNLKYIGHFKNGLRSGTHFEFYEDDSAKIKYQTEYLIEDGVDKIVSSTLYNRDGSIDYTHKYVPKLLKFEIGSDTILSGDTVYLKVSFKNSKYNLIRAYTGEIDKNLGIESSMNIKHYMGKGNVISIPISGNSKGLYQVKGHLIDFNINPIGDSVHVGVTGSEIGEITFFEYNYYVMNSSEI